MKWYYKPDYDPELGDIFWLVPKDFWDERKSVYYMGEALGVPDGFTFEPRRFFYEFLGRKELAIKVLTNAGFIYNKELQ